jgi:hypothetical protein
VADLSGHQRELGGCVSALLQARAPEALRLLPDPDRAGETLLGALQSFAGLVTDFQALSAWARQLGTRSGTVVTATEIAAIGGAVLDALGTVLGPGFGDDERDAWRAGIVLVTELMR